MENGNMGPRSGPDTKFVFFSGKGGVGKTTLAAATAVHLARQGKRVLITSTDPAHSLSDVFQVTIGDKGKVIMPGLFALEVDSSARWVNATGGDDEHDGKKKGRLERAFGDAMKMMGDAPGVDEFMSLELLLQTMASDEFDTVVFDTAPTGHTLRLLMLPGMLDGWVGKLLSVRGAFSRVGRAFRRFLPRERRKDAPDLGEELSEAKDRVGLARDALMDSGQTYFALVTIPEAMGVLETTRTMDYLTEHGIAVSKVFVNQIQPPSDSCDHCKLRNSIHTREIENLRSSVKDIPVQLVYSKPLVIRGIGPLSKLGEQLWEARSIGS